MLDSEDDEQKNLEVSVKENKNNIDRMVKIVVVGNLVLSLALAGNLSGVVQILEQQQATIENQAIVMKQQEEELVVVNEVLVEQENVIAQLEQNLTETKLYVEQLTYEPDVDVITVDTIQHNFTQYEVELLARLIQSEIGGNGVALSQREAVVWCVLNRVDDPRFPSTVEANLFYPNQFSGYGLHLAVKEQFVDVVNQVLCYYEYEKQTGDSSYRVLPSNYYFFRGNGKVNLFRQEDKSTNEIIP